jgi:hypothetical protein
MTRAATAPIRSSSARPRRASAARGPYLSRSIQPLQSLLFLLPLIIFYELGTRLFASDPSRHTEQRIIAFNLLQDFFRFCGASGRYMPALAVVGILLAWHIARNDPWQADWRTLLLMAAESVAFAVPLIFLGYTLTHYLPLHTALGTSVVLSIGAGIYEELVFRLIAFTALHMLLVDVWKMEARRAYLVMVATSAVLFSLYHYLGPETFHWQSFVFRTLAGIYFGALFLTRGFGVTAGAHTTYDILVAILQSAVT